MTTSYVTTPPSSIILDAGGKSRFQPLARCSQVVGFAGESVVPSGLAGVPGAKVDTGSVMKRFESRRRSRIGCRLSDQLGGLPSVEPIGEQTFTHGVGKFPAMCEARRERRCHRW